MLGRLLWYYRTLKANLCQFRARKIQILYWSLNSHSKSSWCMTDPGLFFGPWRMSNTFWQTLLTYRSKQAWAWGVWGEHIPPRTSIPPTKTGWGVWQFFPRSKKLFGETGDLFLWKFLGVWGYTPPPPPQLEVATSPLNGKNVPMSGSKWCSITQSLRSNQTLYVS